MSEKVFPQEKYDQENYTNQRLNMVNSQIKSRGITDPQVINALMNVERHLFVPESHKGEAYDDHPLPIGEGQTISQPYIVAFMTEALDLTQNSRVLEIGTGSGYQAAVLAEICDSVFTIEIFETLAIKAKTLLHDLDYKNVEVKTDDGYKGWPEKAPFDAIIVTCAPNDVPKPLIDQLKENGKIIIPVGSQDNQNLVILEKINGRIREKQILPVRFVPMINENGIRY